MNIPGLLKNHRRTKRFISSSSKQPVSKFLSRAFIPLVIIVMSVLIILPVGALLFGSFWSSRPGTPGYLTLENYAKTFSDVRSLKLLTNSLFYSFGSALLATLLGIIIAFITSRTDTPLRGLFTYIPFLSLITPGIVNSIAWVYLLSPNTGLINVFFRTLLGLKSALFDIYSIWGMIWVAGLSLFPLAYVGVRAALVSLDSSLEEAGRISGGGIKYVIFRVTLPLVIPAILSVFLLTFIIAFEGFDTPAMIGIPGNIDVYMVDIARSIIYMVPPNHGLAASQSIIVVFITFILIYLYRRAIKRTEKFVVITGRGYSPKIMKLGRWKYLGLAFLLGYLVVDIILPYFTLLMASFHLFWDPGRLFKNLTLQNYIELTTYPSFLTGTFNSILISVVSATVTIGVALLITYLSLRTKMKWRGLLEGLGMLPRVFPGLVLGVGFLWVAVSLPTALYGTIFLLILAYIVKYIPHGVRFLSEPLLQIHRDLEDASRVSGASLLYTIRRIVVVIIRPALIGGWVYIALISFRELGAAVLLVSPGTPVISAELYRMWATGNVEHVVAASIVLIAVLWSIVIIGSVISKALLTIKPTT